jgi:hypothetical protein
MDQTDRERERFERIFRENHIAVHAYVRRRVTAEGVDDVVSETFLVAWRRLGALPEEPLPWLLGVARNVIARDAALPSDDPPRQENRQVGSDDHPLPGLPDPQRRGCLARPALPAYLRDAAASSL